MNGSMHMMMGMAVGCSAGIVLFNEPKDAALFTIGTIIGSLLPDIDQPTSKVGHLVPPISKLLKKTFGHRGFIHTPFFMVLMYLLLYYFFGFNGFIIGLTTGYGTHLLQDLFTKGGIMLLYPFVKTKFKLTFFKSGGTMDFITTCVLLGIYSFGLSQFVK